MKVIGNCSENNEDLKYKLVFMDLNMPVMNGILATQRLRQLHEEKSIDLKQCKIILYSCLSKTSDMQEF